MMKRLIGGLLAMLMVINIVCFDNLVYAFESFQVEVTTATLTVRAEASQDSKVKKNLKKGDKLTVIGEKKNKYGKLWYKVSGGYVYSGKVKRINNTCPPVTSKPTLTPSYTPAKELPKPPEKTVHVCDYKFKEYQKQHPHYAVYECSCGRNYHTDKITKVNGCTTCYPPAPKQDMGKPTLEPMYTPPESNADLTLEPQAGNLIKGSNGEASGNSQNNNNSGNRSGYSSNNSGEHKHNYALVGFEVAHPHYAVYECSCGFGYCSSTELGRRDDCNICNPLVCKNLQDDHICNLVSTGKRLKEHPHYLIEKCSICGKEHTNTDSIGYYSQCRSCQNPFADGKSNYSDFFGRVYDIGSGKLSPLNPFQLNAMKEFAADAHFSLDLFGMIPAIGEIFDGINVAYYIVEGKYGDALLSGIGLIPFVGIASTSGKMYKRSGEYAVDAVSHNTDNVLRLTMDGLDRTSDIAQEVLRHTDDYGENTLRTIRKITEDESIELADSFVDGQTLISREYKGVITSPAGLKYASDAPCKEGHRIHHIIERHSASKYVEHTRDTFFNVADEEIFYAIDDAYRNGELIGLASNGNRTIYEFELGYAIGLEGETKMRILLEDGENVITAYPIK